MEGIKKTCKLSLAGWFILRGYVLFGALHSEVAFPALIMMTACSHCKADHHYANQNKYADLDLLFHDKVF